MSIAKIGGRSEIIIERFYLLDKKNNYHGADYTTLVDYAPHPISCSRLELRSRLNI